MRVRQLGYLLSATAALLLFSVQPLMAQRGKLVVRVVPREAYIFADGIPVVDANHHFVVLDAGEHKIDLYNYGYKPASRNVTIEAGKTTRPGGHDGANPRNRFGTVGLYYAQGRRPCRGAFERQGPCLLCRARRRI